MITGSVKEETSLESVPRAAERKEGNQPSSVPPSAGGRRTKSHGSVWGLAQRLAGGVVGLGARWR